MSASAANPADVFAALDRNHDGVVSRQEFYGAMAGQFGGVPAEPVAAPYMSMAPPQVMSYAPPAMMQHPTTVTAPPVYMSGPPPQAAPPQAVFAQGQPAMSYGPPTTVTAPPVYMTAPAQMAQAPPQTLFDAVDRNHDGVITREEFAAMQGVRQAPPMMSYAPPTTVTAPPVYMTAPAPMPAPQLGSTAFMQEPVVGQQFPVHVQSAPQVISYGAPQMLPPQPQPQPQAMPSFAPPTTVTAPPVYVNAFQTAPAATTMFDALDRNHDGVITREEFAGAVAASAPGGGSASAPQMVYGAPQVTTAAPVYITQPAAMASVASQQFMQEPVAMPQQHQMFAAPPAVTYAAPQMSSYVPPPQPQPQVTVSYLPPTTVQAPPVYMTMPAAGHQYAAPSMFDQLDRNHDGVITREEFAGAVAGGSASAPAARVVSYAAQPQPQVMPADPNAQVRMLPPVYVNAQAQQMHSFQPPPPTVTAVAAPVYMQGPPMQEPSVGAPQVVQYGAPQVFSHTAPQTFAPQMSYSQGAPQVTTMAAPPTIYQAPQTMAGGFPMEPVAGGQMMYQAPPTVIHQQPADLFSAMDRNHDGVLTREEFNAAVAGR